MDRFRTFTDSKVASENWSVTVGPFGTHYGVRETTHVRKVSHMQDAIHGNLRPESPCAHRKTLVVAGSYPKMDPKPWIPPEMYTTQVHAPESEICFDPDVIPPVPSDWTEGKFDRFLKDANKSFTSQFDESASLANFVLEFKDFKSTLKSIRQLASPHGPRGFARKVGKFLHERADNGIGGNFLDLELNWKAFVSDLPKILGAYTRAMERLKFLVGHSTFHSHRRKRFTIEPGQEGFDEILVLNVGTLIPTAPTGWTYALHLVPDHCQVEFNASAVIDNRLELEGINAWWGVADTLGLNNSVKIVWNAVKLSWVMDMVIDSSEFLDAFEVEAYKGTLAVLSGSASWKVKRWYNIRCRTSGAPPDSLTEENVGSVLVTDYLRAPMNLVDSGFFALRPGLTVQQGALLSALVDAKVGASRGAYRSLRSLTQTFLANRGGFGRSYWKRR